MSLNPANYEQAKIDFKPMRRSGMARKASLRGKTSLKATGRKQKPIKKKVKRLSVGKLKKKVWTEFSIFIRTRGADEAGINKCVTCGISAHWKTLQAGHFIRGRLNSNLFSERGCWAQCYGCNVGRQGDVVIYYKVMLFKYGQEVIDELIQQNERTHKWQAGELEGLLERYKTLNANNPVVKCESP